MVQVTYRLCQQNPDSEQEPGFYVMSIGENRSIISETDIEMVLDLLRLTKLLTM